MLLSKKTLEILRSIINGDGTDHYRSGPKLVSFFNQLGFNDAYGQGFPSRWAYTDDRLQRINGTPELDKCIKMTFAVIDFVGEIDTLDQLIAQFNQYMAFDGKLSEIMKSYLSNDLIRLSYQNLKENPRKYKKKTS